MIKDSKIYIAGHNGMVGSSILRLLESEGYSNLFFRSYSDLDLRDQDQVKGFFEKEKPEYVFLAAAKVGGILANNTYKADFLYDNMMIQNNVIHQSFKNGVKKLLFLGSSCIYPKFAKQPLKEEYLLSGRLEPTNESYAIAKISGIKMCEFYNEQYDCNFISAMPTNLYGPNDNFDLEKAHVVPALIRKIHLGKALENNDWKSIKEDLNKLPIGKSALFVSGDKLDDNFNKALKNIPMHDILPIQGANVYDILRRETLILSKSSVEALENRLAVKEPKNKVSKEVK